MYSNKLVACLKSGGKVLREKGEEVYLPFGSEYTLFFKNENNRKVEITIEIDGQDVLFGKGLLLNAGESMDLKGFLRDINGGEDNRAFKFITKTQEISDFRGDRAEDGLVKISYRFENEYSIPTIHSSYSYDTYPKTYRNCGGHSTFGDSTKTMNLDNIFGNISNNVNNTTKISYATNSVTNSINSTTTASLSSEPGITVEGSATGQSFKKGYVGLLEDKKYTMIFQLKGLTAEEQIQEPVTVNVKKQCPSCGKLYKSSFSYCPQDGTYLR